ncbi:hypothetical protein [Streptomyces asoensis]|uniref:hypothetical protein n=1 Tax=Streptomyces asoensis TaxID=249586 RepID=UPI00355800F9
MPPTWSPNGDPGAVFDRSVGLDGVPEGYRAMDARTALKVRITLCRAVSPV